MREGLGDDASISDNEVVLRRISERAYIFDENLGRFRPSSQAFSRTGLTVLYQYTWNPKLLTTQ